MVLSAFEKLPAELRNRIYEFALVSDEAIAVKLDYRTRDGAHMSRIRDPPAPSGTCKLIRNEASAIYYGRNVFSHDCEKNVLTRVWLRRWLGKLRTEDIRVLRHVGFDIDSASKDATVKALAEAGIDVDRKMLRPVTYTSDGRVIGAYRTWVSG